MTRTELASVDPVKVLAEAYAVEMEQRGWKKPPAEWTEGLFRNVLAAMPDYTIVRRAVAPDERLRAVLEQADWLGLIPEYDDTETGTRPDCIRKLRALLAEPKPASPAVEGA